MIGILLASWPEEAVAIICLASRSPLQVHLGKDAIQTRGWGRTGFDFLSSRDIVRSSHRARRDQESLDGKLRSAD